MNLFFIDYNFVISKLRINLERVTERGSKKDRVFGTKRTTRNTKAEIAMLENINLKPH